MLRVKARGDAACIKRFCSPVYDFRGWDMSYSLKILSGAQQWLCLMIGSSKNKREREKTIRENAFEHKKKKPGLNLTPG